MHERAWMLRYTYIDWYFNKKIFKKLYNVYIWYILTSTTELITHCGQRHSPAALPPGETQGTPVEMWWHTVTHGRGSEGENGEWSG